MAVNSWFPFDVCVVFHVIEYGCHITSAPRLTPFNLNWTPAIPTVLEAAAETATEEPETVELETGAVRETEVLGEVSPDVSPPAVGMA